MTNGGSPGGGIYSVGLMMSNSQTTLTINSGTLTAKGGTSTGTMAAIIGANGYADIAADPLYYNRNASAATPSVWAKVTGSSLFYHTGDLTSGHYQITDDVSKTSTHNVSWSGMTANGTSGSETTTELTLSFDKDPVVLAAADITVTGATKGTLTGTGTSRTLKISGITVADGANVTVAVTNPFGLNISPASKTVAVNVAVSGTNYTLYLDNTSGDLKAGSSGAVLAAKGTAYNGDSGTATVSGSASPWTLTLNNFEFETSALTALEVPANTTIKISGDNSISGGSTANTSATTTYGIKSSGALTIEQASGATGSLTVTAGNTGTQSGMPSIYGNTYGVDVGSSTLTIKSGTVNINAGKTMQGSTDNSAAAVSSAGVVGTLVVDGGIVTITGPKRALSVSYTIPAGYTYEVSTSLDGSSPVTTALTSVNNNTHKYAKIVVPAASLGTLTVSLTAGDGKVTLAKQTAETGFKFYYKNTAASQAGSKPALDAAFSAGGWTELTANADITGANGTEIFVQVVKVETSGSKIKAWGEDSATPALGAPVITITTQPAGNTTVTEGDISGSLTVAASVTQSKTLSYQWYKNSTNSNSGGTAESGSTSASFTIPTGLTKGTYYYYCVVSADGGAADVASSVAAVKVTGPPYKITFNRHDGFGGTAEITAYDGSPMPQITPPVLPGLTFKGYFSEEDGDGTKYYDKDGKSVHDGNSDHDELHANFE